MVGPPWGFAWSDNAVARCYRLSHVWLCLQRWRLYVAPYKQEFMAYQPSLFIFLSRNAKRACYFYSIFDHRFYKAKLPNLVGKSCTGITCGYLVMKDKKKTENSQIWPLNPSTRHELHFPNPPNVCSRFILASLATTLPAFVLIAFGWCGPYLQFCRSTDISWTVYDSRDKFIGFVSPFLRLLMEWSWRVRYTSLLIMLKAWNRCTKFEFSSFCDPAGSKKHWTWNFSLGNCGYWVLMNNCWWFMKLHQMNMKFMS